MRKRIYEVLYIIITEFFLYCIRYFCGNEPNDTVHELATLREIITCLKVLSRVDVTAVFFRASCCFLIDPHKNLIFLTTGNSVCVTVIKAERICNNCEIMYHENKVTVIARYALRNALFVKLISNMRVRACTARCSITKWRKNATRN